MAVHWLGTTKQWYGSSDSVYACCVITVLLWVNNSLYIWNWILWICFIYDLSLLAYEIRLSRVEARTLKLLWWLRSMACVNWRKLKLMPLWLRLKQRKQLLRLQRKPLLRRHEFSVSFVLYYASIVLTRCWPYFTEAEIDAIVAEIETKKNSCWGCKERSSKETWFYVTFVLLVNCSC